MSLRFQRRISIAKGTYLNLSKSGIGMGLGQRGFGISTGPRGSIVHAGIPGTGLSYRSSMGSGSSTKLSRTSGNGTIGVRLDEQNRVRIATEGGEFLDDNDIRVKRIKRTVEYKNAVKELNRQAINVVSEKTIKITDIFKNTPGLVTKEYLEGLLQRKPYSYEKKQYSELYPTSESCSTLLTTKPSFFHSLVWTLFPRSKVSYVKKNLPSRFSQEINRWNKGKAEFDANEDDQLTITAKSNKEMEAEIGRLVRD